MKILNRIAGFLFVPVFLMACPVASDGQVSSAPEHSPAIGSTGEADRLEMKAKLALEDGNNAKRVKLLESSLAIREKLQGPEHPDTVNCLHKLGLSYGFLHDRKKADPCLNRVYEIRVKSLGRDHLLVAETLDTMAGVSLENGDWRVAKDKYLEALEIKRTVAGPESLDVAESYHNISILAFLIFQASGKKFKAVEEPDKLLRIALRIREEKLGPDDPKVAETLPVLSQPL
jgi:hypothetical protein